MEGLWLGVLGGAGGGGGVGWRGLVVGLEGGWLVETGVGGVLGEGWLAGGGGVGWRGRRVFWGGLGGEGVLAGGCGVWLEGLAGGVVRVGAGKRAVGGGLGDWL